MRLLLDAMFTPMIARELRARGHDVEAVTGNADRENLDDPEILAIARAERRALVTNNVRDFRPLHYEAVASGGIGHYGMIFVSSARPRTKKNTGAIIAALERILAEHPGDGDLANGEAWV